MQLFLSVFLLISSSLFSQELFVQEEEKNLYRSAVEYSFDEVLDNGSYTFLFEQINGCLLYTSPSPRDRQKSRMPSSA